MTPLPETSRSRISTCGIADMYLDAKSAVISAGFASEIDWLAGLRFGDLTESWFLREAAWVVLSSGIAEHVVRSRFAAISGAFMEFESANTICANSKCCRRRALAHFRHVGKIDAILGIAVTVSQLGFLRLKSRIGSERVAFLQTLPYVGPTTCFHLAKNIGLNVAKPDRHLLRIAAAMGYSCPGTMCEAISDVVGDTVAVVDVVLWRYATLRRDYLTALAGIEVPQATLRRPS